MTMKRDCEGPTFGISLTLLCERSGVEVPLILGDILRWLAAHALAQPDVFAEAPRCVATSQLRNAIDSGTSLSELVDGRHPAVVGSLLKRWLEELPDPLLNWDQQVELLSACKDEGCIEARIASLNDAVALVDQISLGTLKPLLLFLQQYCFRQRRFDQQLLQVAVAFAPILFPAALAAGPAELRLAEETVATLVSNALHVFNPTLAANVPVVTPQALCEAAAEIMESQQQQPDDRSLGCADMSRLLSPRQHGGPEAAVSASTDDRQPLQEQTELNSEGPSYEPYLQDGPFLASLNDMVDSCVAAALFSFDGSAEFELPAWVDDDCGSMTSSCSNINLSGGGAASSGGASSCSFASVALSQGDLCHPPQQPGHHHQHHHHHHHHGSANTVHAVCRRSNHEGGAQTDAPYSPRAVLVAPLGNDEVRLAGATAVKAAGQVVAVKASPTPVSPAALAELAQHEVSEGAVFCIISAQPSAAALVAAAAAAVDASGDANCASGKKSTGDYIPAIAPSLQQQRHQHPAPDVVDLQAALLGVLQPDSPSSARPVTTRRPTEGGAPAAAPEPCAASRAHADQVSGGPRSVTRLPAAGQAGEPRQRRMTMGGGDFYDASGSSESQQAHGASVSVSSAVTALYQHLPQLRNRLAGSGGSGSGGGSGGVSLQSADRDRLPPPAAASPSSFQGGGGSGCIAELGIAGHLRVSVTGALTLAVRELTTPEAMAHRVPIRGMSAAAMQGEKERLKRQLKEVAAAYEALAGRSLTQALKEPLRPVYVRYHKIKALLSSGRTVPGQGTAGAPSGRAQQRPSAAFVSARPSVVA